MKVKSVLYFPDTNAVEATWVNDAGTNVKCQFYSGGQMDSLRADLGPTDAAKYADIILLAESQYVPPTPAPAQPIKVSPWQLRKALNQLNLRVAVESWVATASQTIKDGWEFATEFREDDSFVQEAGVALGKTPEELHQLFVLAETL